MKHMLQVFILMMAFNAFAETAEENCDPTPSGVKPLLAVANAVKNSTSCPNGEKLPAVCMAISNAQKDTSGKFQFHYQKLIAEAACVTATDNEATTARKVQQMWKQFEDRLVCNNASFTVQQGNVLKFAASMRFEDFLFDAAMIWKVDLNRVDQSDNRTVLDYVKDEMDRHKGKAIEKSLRSYYEMLRSSGAKHKSEL